MIESINLCKSFGEHKVLNNLNLTINTGETTVVIGRSGCGKSVFLKHIIGILKPDSGQVFIDGKDMTRLKGKELNNIRMKFGMLFQGSALFDSLSVWENVAFSLLEHGNKNALALWGWRAWKSLNPRNFLEGCVREWG